MKKIIYSAFILMLFVACQQPQKIGFVDNGSVINDFQQKKDVEAQYQIKNEAFRKRADSVGQAFQAEVQQTQATAQKSSQKRAQELMGGLQQKQQQLQQTMQVEQQEIQQAFQVEIDSVISQVKTFVKTYGKENGYNFILGTSDAAATVMYGDETHDLTAVITEALNAKYKKEE
ncbi:OmpH family outer membrane protein [Changchengzhania lutea]|uniref:OmpH family outer membrane protein n=1 Tax=Changchengzhania lutea TaxID=2049305 RepID=UPI00115D8976|nr:OmpH family outer membrane protein [Changchengzhania lutea]